MVQPRFIRLYKGFVCVADRDSSILSKLSSNEHEHHPTQLNDGYKHPAARAPSDSYATTAKHDDSPSLDWKNLNNGARVLKRGERFNKLWSISTPLSSVIEFDDAMMVLLLATVGLAPL